MGRPNFAAAISFCINKICVLNGLVQHLNDFIRKSFTGAIIYSNLQF